MWMPAGNYVSAMGTISFFVFAYSCTQVRKDAELAKKLGQLQP